MCFLLLLSEGIFDMLFRLDRAVSCHCRHNDGTMYNDDVIVIRVLLVYGLNYVDNVAEMAH